MQSFGNVDETEIIEGGLGSRGHCDTRRYIGKCVCRRSGTKWWNPLPLVALEDAMLKEGHIQAREAPLLQSSFELIMDGSIPRSHEGHEPECPLNMIEWPKDNDGAGHCPDPPARKDPVSGEHGVGRQRDDDRRGYCNSLAPPRPLQPPHLCRLLPTLRTGPRRLAPRLDRALHVIPALGAAQPPACAIPEDRPEEEEHADAAERERKHSPQQRGRERHLKVSLHPATFFNDVLH